MENIVEIQEEVRIPQGDQELVLEKGDKIQIIKEDQTITWKDFLGMKLLAQERLSEFVFEVPYQKIKVEGSYVSCMLLGKSLHMKFKNKIDTFTLTPDPSDVVTIYEDDNYGFKVQLKEFNGVFYGYYQKERSMEIITFNCKEGIL